jgi:hypothetical protein
MGAGHGAHAKNALAAALAMRPLWPMGLSGPGGRAGADWVGPTGSAQTGRIGFLFFTNLFLMRKQIPEKSRNCLKARKILRKSQKIQENS